MLRGWLGREKSSESCARWSNRLGASSDYGREVTGDSRRAAILDAGGNTVYLLT